MYFQNSESLKLLTMFGWVPANSSTGLLCLYLSDKSRESKGEDLELVSKEMMTIIRFNKMWNAGFWEDTMAARVKLLMLHHLPCGNIERREFASQFRTASPKVTPIEFFYVIVRLCALLSVCMSVCSSLVLYRSVRENKRVGSQSRAFKKEGERERKRVGKGERRHCVPI